MHTATVLGDAHAVTIDQLVAQLGTSVSGLSDSEAAARLEKYGSNRLAGTKPVSAFAILLAQLRGVVVWLLAAAAVISLTLGESVEAAAIAAVLVLNTMIGFITEWRARRAMDALLDLDVPRAFVVRDGRLRAIDAHQLVPGDVIEVNAGQQVPADGRVIEESDLQTGEAALTGESMPVGKVATDVAIDTPLADRRNMVFKGSTVAGGTGRILVTGTGMSTEVGRIGLLVGGVHDEPTPLERRLDALGRRLVWLALAVAGLVALLGALQGMPVALLIETAIALAVAAVPEGLPAVATIALAVGVRRMAVRRALVRRLPAVEALGSTTVVCTDKTRTLTSGEMAAVKLWTEDGDTDLRATASPTLSAAARHTLEVAALASRDQIETAGDDTRGRDPVDAALLAAAAASGIDRAALIAVRPAEGLVPFSSERKFMAAFHRDDGALVAFVKGAPRRVLDLSTTGPGDQPLDRAAMIAINDRLAASGLRVIALATGPVPAASADALTSLRFLGFVGLMDPPAPGVKETVGRLRDAGLRTVMLTGDQRLTAQAIGHDLGLVDEGMEVLEGRDLDSMDTAELTRRLATAAIFSRITPEHKLTIVSGLQARGDVVAMLGDGVNDAPALKKADVGVAMGKRGTDVAKQAAAIVLQDDRFETIAAAVEEGRVIFDNIRKFVFYLFSCNVAEILVLLAAGAAGWPLPLQPLHLLWLNMVTDTLPALALAMEPADRGVMNRPPRDPQEAILSPQFLRSILFYGGLIAGATLAAFLWTLRTSAADAQTVALMTLAFAQILHLGNARSDEPVLTPRRIVSNPYALAAAAGSILLQFLVTYVPPIGRVLHVAAIDAAQWTLVIGLALIPAVVGQSIKLVTAGRARSADATDGRP